MRDTSLACLLDFGLKSQSRATRSHSVPGLVSSRSEIIASSAALHATEEKRRHGKKKQSVDENSDTRKAPREPSAEHVGKTLTFG